ncbi:TSPAN18 [Mytilus coruscus]|uniref:TSPAN18 n=1 Tax=Mytilus coruscus TaxID=42192 RepID=A0A6J8C9T1_MYTCO|nr:TSPAN18 [Mytilus coruscus]
MIFGGMLLKSNSATIGGDSFPMLEDKILPLLKKVGIGPDFDMEEIFEIVAMAIIASGVAVACVAFIGFCGACCKWRPFLILYAVILLCVSAGEMVVVYYLIEVKTEVNKTVEVTLLGLLSTYEGNFGGIITMAWNGLFVTFECCGVNKQSETDDFSMSIWNSTRGSQIIPGYCCKGADYLSGLLLAGKECTTNPTSLNSYYGEGCYTAIEEAIEEYSSIFISTSIAVLVVEMVAVIASFCLFVQMVAVIASFCMCRQISADLEHSNNKRKNANKRWIKHKDNA